MSSATHYEGQLVNSSISNTSNGMIQFHPLTASSPLTALPYDQIANMTAVGLRNISSNLTTNATTTTTTTSLPAADDNASPVVDTAPPPPPATSLGATQLGIILGAILALVVVSAYVRYLYIKTKMWRLKRRVMRLEDIEMARRVARVAQALDFEITQVSISSTRDSVV